jgi:rsbT co-antagonist protein RsbR
MENSRKTQLGEIMARRAPDILKDWVALQVGNTRVRRNLIKETEIQKQSEEFLSVFGQAIGSGSEEDIGGPSWDGVRTFLSELSRNRAIQGFTPKETATFVFSLKQPLYDEIRKSAGANGADAVAETWRATVLLDELGLYTTEVFQKAREEVISRQQRELLELSTPVVKLWDGILALPLIGTLDSERTQVVMESLLQTIVDTGAGIAIIDITGVPTVDTLVAQHLLKTVAAARLMGAECIISGIRPQIAATIVHLGVELHSVVTKATLADAFAVALFRTGQSIVKTRVLPKPEASHATNPNS